MEWDIRLGTDSKAHETDTRHDISAKCTFKSEFQFGKVVSTCQITWKFTHRHFTFNNAKKLARNTFSFSYWGTSRPQQPFSAASWNKMADARHFQKTFAPPGGHNINYLIAAIRFLNSNDWTQRLDIACFQTARSSSTWITHAFH